MINKMIIKNKKGLQFKAALFALVGMSLAIVAIGIWIHQWNMDYGGGLTYDLGNFSKLNETYTYASGSRGDISVSSDPRGEDFEGTSLRGAFSIINNIFVPFDVVFGKGGLLDSIRIRWEIPDYIIIGAFSMMIIAIVFSIIALFFRKPTPA